MYENVCHVMQKLLPQYDTGMPANSFGQDFILGLHTPIFTGRSTCVLKYIFI